MDRYIGLDPHKETSTFTVLSPRGKVLKTEAVETHGKALVEFLKLTPGTRHLCIEEGTHSQWLYEILSPHVHEIAVVPGEKRKGNKSDAVDSRDLAERMRTGSLHTKVYKPPRAFASLRDMVRTYGMITADVVRNKNRIKSFYRSRGITLATKSEALDPTTREKIMKRLQPGGGVAVGYLCKELDCLEQLKAELQELMLKESAKQPITRILKTGPGIGPIRAAQLLAVVVTPERFRTLGQFWSYCGLAVVLRTSADWQRLPNGKLLPRTHIKTRGLNRNFNPTLKAVFKGAATTVVTQMPTSQLYEYHQQLLARELDPDVAKVTLARKIAAIVLAMWKNKEVFDPAKHRDNQK